MHEEDIVSRDELIQKVERSIESLSQGNMIIVVDDYDRENEGDLVAIAEKASAGTINFMATYGRGLICQPITGRKAEDLELPLMTPHNSDHHGTAFTVSVDHVGATTGISAFERARTVNAIADNNAHPEDFIRPGHVFPLIARDGGVAERRGHTEAAVDLAELAGCAPSGVICEIMNDDGTMARMPDLELVAEHHDLLIISVDELLKYRSNLHFGATLQNANAYKR